MTETASLPDFPIQLVPAEPVIPNASATLYREPPQNGYFYSSKHVQVKKYALQKSGGNSGIDEGVFPASTDHFDKRPGYAASHHSASASVFPTQPRHPVMVPVRTYQPALPPAFVRPVLVAPPPHPALFSYPRPRFFSPPPPVLRVRPVPMFVPPPVSVIYDDDSHTKTRGSGRVSRESSRSSSESSIPGSPRLNGKPQKKAHENHARDNSSSSSSRPRTPPTDYDVPRGPRVSRREEFYTRQNLTRDRTGSPRAFARKGHKGYYMVPPYGYYGHPTASLGRPRSVPPYGERTLTKSKNKKSKKKKKDGKKSKKGSYEDPEDELTDSVGYMSELAGTADSKQPRDFRRLENQFKHERAFSKSLAEETRHSVRGNSAFNAYSLNNTTGTNENDFPPTMY